MSELDRRLAAVAAVQHQLVTSADVRDAGGTPAHCRTRVEAGRWSRVDRGVFLIASAPFGWEARMHAAVLAAGEGAAVSHLAGARLFQWSGFSTALPELTIPRGRRYRRQGVRTHESTDLERCSITTRDGIPVTDPARTLLDVGRYVGVARLSRVVEGARRQGDVTWSSVIACLAAHARRGRPGIRRLRAVILADAHRSEVTDTDMELMVLSILREGGCPEPVVHHRVMAGERFVAEVDLAYPQWKIAIECDGSVHRLEEVHDRDLARQNDLVLEGWTVLRFSWERVRSRPDLVLAEVRAALATARR